MQKQDTGNKTRVSALSIPGTSVGEGAWRGG